LEILEDRILLSTYMVNSLTDTGSGSGLAGDLRYCLTKATSGNDTITFASTLQGTIDAESALPSLNVSVAIEGPGDNPGGLGSRLNVDYGQFFVGSTATVAISGLGIYYGVINNVGTLTLSACNMGSGIQNSGTATVSDCYFGGAGVNNYGTMTISNSSFEGEFGLASGIANSGMLTVNYSTLSGNLGGSDAQGGAVFNQGAVTINNSTITGNENGVGGGIYMGAGTLSINSSTLAGNSAMGGDGGGLYIAGGTVSINNTTFADNQGTGGDIYNAAGPSALNMYDTILADDLNGSVTSLGHNLINNSADGSGFAATDLLNVNPLLGPLQDNGGASSGGPLAQHEVQTMALLAGSPAIDAGDNTNAPAYDQRGPGFSRIVNGTIDIGAFEVQTTQSISLTVAGFPSNIVAGTAGNLTVTVHNADASTDTGYTGTLHFTSSDGQAGLPADYTFTPTDAGVHTFTATLKMAGTQSITVSDASAGVSASESGIVVNPAAAKQFIIMVPSSVNAGAAFSLTLTVEDAYGNVVTGYIGTVHFSSTDTHATLPKNYAFTAADQGVHTFTGLILRKRGNQKITITDTHDSSLTGSTVVDVL
jgi:hypothetical protein